MLLPEAELVSEWQTWENQKKAKILSQFSPVMINNNSDSHKNKPETLNPKPKT